MNMNNFTKSIKSILIILLFFIMISILIIRIYNLIYKRIDSNNIKQSALKEFEKIGVPEDDSKKYFYIFANKYLEKINYHSNVNVPNDIKLYLGIDNYKVIFYEDIDGDGVNDIFAINEVSNVYKGLKKGVIIDNNSKVKLYIDSEKGIYTKSNWLINFNKIGLTNNVYCIRVLFNINDIDYNKNMMHTGILDENYNYAQFIFYQLIDSNLNNISSIDNFMASYDTYLIYKKLDVNGSNMIFVRDRVLSCDEQTDLDIKNVIGYINNKKIGKVYKVPNFIP